MLIEGEEIIWELFIIEEIFLVVFLGYCLLECESVYLYEVKDELFISMNIGYGFWYLIDEFCKEVGFILYIVFEVDELIVISDFIK